MVLHEDPRRLRVGELPLVPRPGRPQGTRHPPAGSTGRSRSSSSAKMRRWRKTATHWPPSPRRATRSATTASTTNRGCSSTRKNRLWRRSPAPRRPSRRRPVNAPEDFAARATACRRATLEVLSERGYLFDASTFPTFLGPLARAYYFHTAKLTPEEKEQRRILFGGFKDGLRPVKPYLWDLHDGELLEIPVTTLPVLKVPFHFSYLLYLATFSAALAMLYFRASPRRLPGDRDPAVAAAPPARFPRR